MRLFRDGDGLTEAAFPSELELRRDAFVSDANCARGDSSRSLADVAMSGATLTVSTADAARTTLDRTAGASSSVLGDIGVYTSDDRLLQLPLHLIPRVSYALPRCK